MKFNLIKVAKCLMCIICTVLLSFSVYNYYQHHDKTSNSRTNNQTIKRLAESINCNWGLEAIGINDEITNNIKYSVKIAVVDSGINIRKDNIKKGYNAINKTDNIFDNIGHGTSVASLILDINNKASIVPVKIFDKEGEYVSPDILKDALRWSIEQNVDIINLSLGMEDKDYEMDQLLNIAKSKGIIVVASSGNYGLNKLVYPASNINTISVISRDIDNFDNPNSNKSNEKKSISAPGIHIVTKEGNVVSGSSFATAYVSGCIGVYKSIFKNSKLDSIIDIFYRSAVDGNDYSYGMIRLDKAISESRTLFSN